MKTKRGGAHGLTRLWPVKKAVFKFFYFELSPVCFKFFRRKHTFHTFTPFSLLAPNSFLSNMISLKKSIWRLREEAAKVC